MIWDSAIWKSELKREIKNFHRIMVFENVVSSHGEDYFWLRIERFFFVSFFIIRKLVEAKKLSDELENKNIVITKYPRINMNLKIDFMNSHHYGQFYNLQKLENYITDLITLCNLFIHSFVFQPAFYESLKEERLTIMGVFINSDRTKDKALYYIDIKDLFLIFNDVIYDNISFGHFDKITGKYRKSKTDNIQSKNQRTD